MKVQIIIYFCKPLPEKFFPREIGEYITGNERLSMQIDWEGDNWVWM